MPDMEPTATAHVAKNNARLEANAKVTLGFWIYIMTDCVLFASLFAVYAVLHKNTFGGPSGQQLFSLRYVLVETMALLTSSYTNGLAMLSVRRNKKNWVIFWFVITILLGLTFLGMELTEFRHFYLMGDSWRRSGFLSGYFTLVGTHGLHITIGLLWIVVLLFHVVRRGLTPSNIKKLTLFSMFWHFLDIIWIFIFTIVYLMGAVGK